MSKLTAKQERFVEQYLIEPNATQAAIRAGYSAKTAESIGHENLRKPKISEKLEKARAERAERCALSADWVVEELHKLASSNMGDYMKPTPEGTPHLDFSGLTRDQTGVISQVKVSSDGTITFRLHDRRAALVDLGRHLGIFDLKARKPKKVKIEVAQIREKVLRALARLADARKEESGGRVDDPGGAGGVPA
jgi:phage terminase small subunit